MDREKVREFIPRFVADLETGLTEEHCLCEWEISPHNGAKQRVALLNLECPVHSKEGLLLYFYDRMTDANEHS